MATPSADEIRSDLSYLFDKASQALSARMADALAPLSISARDYCVLTKAAEAELTQGELAERALMDKTTMVVTLDRLEGQGLARRVPSPTDRRARIVETTEACETTIADAKKVIDGLYAEVLGALAPEQREVFLDAMVTLVGPGGPLSAVDPTPHAPRRRSAR